ncbi:MAG: phosphoserine transaminase [Parvularculaceae bacterium]
MTTKPATRPARPFFSSGPCAKRPGWSADRLSAPTLGRSHRAKIGKTRLKEAIDRTRALLEIPSDYRLGIVPASDTGAVEMAMWSLLGPRTVDLVAFESFGEGWVSDAQKQLKLKTRVIAAEYGALPDLSEVDPRNDLVFTWNGTTSGVRVPNADFISDQREGVVICDATSAAFAQAIDWRKVDATTFSWQKALGGEAAHGMLVLSPRAVERLQSHTPSWPMPKIFRLTKGGKLMEDVFEGATLNTPSMLCVEDWIDALKWGAAAGGLKGLAARADANLAALEAWVGASRWAAFLCADASVRSNTSVCLKIIDPRVAALGEEGQRTFVKKMETLLETEAAAYDIGGYRDAPPGLRIWCGATVERADVCALTAWLDWAFEEASA